MKVEDGGASAGLASKYRWTICALIFFAVTVNYLDRQLFSLLVPYFENDLRLSPIDLALINVSFLVPYGFSMLFVGRWIDRIGLKKGISGTFLLWNVASVSHALVSSLGGFMGVRLLLGVGESGMYPGAVKAMTDWLPKKERALGNGFVNAGANCGALLAPILGVMVANLFGWRTCFMIVGGIGIVWIFFWRRMYQSPEDHPQVSPSELAYIQDGREGIHPPISFNQLFAMRPVLGLAIAKAMTDAPWWFYLTWMPKFLVDQFHLTTTFMAIAIPVIYLVADVGSVFGGWLSSTLIKQGKSVGTARKIAMLTCALLVVPVTAVGHLVDVPNPLGISSVFWVVAIVAVAAGAHQGFSSNLFTMISDTVPQSSVAMAVGGVNGIAMVGASAMQFFVAWSVSSLSSYTLPFLLSGTLYLGALGVIHLLIPKVHPSPTDRTVKTHWIIAGGVTILAVLGYFQYLSAKPKYTSLDQYRTQRAVELKAIAAPTDGPQAKVGWMNAQWFEWQLEGGKRKLELVKMDATGIPFLEAKGSAASRYIGPKL